VTRARPALPFVTGALAAAGLAGCCFALQAILPRPAEDAQLGARVVSRLEHVRTIRTVEFLRPGGRFPAVCRTRPGSDRIVLGRRIRITVIGTNVYLARAERERPLYPAAQADLAACPRLLEKELIARLQNGAPLEFAATRYHGTRVYGVRLSARPAVRLLVRRRALLPVALEYRSRRLIGFSRVTSSTTSAGSRLDPRSFLALAKDGLAAARRAWWNARLGWYDDELVPRRSMPLAYLWSVFPLFQAYTAVAVAEPTKANRAALDAFARGAERYWNPLLRPAGGYAYYPGRHGAHLRTYFDDNGWFAIAFADAYRATGERRYLDDAARALRFIASSGWDARGGGIWWDTSHGHTTSEPLAAAAYAAAALYHASRERRYRDEAVRLVRWADAHLRDPRTGLYGRNPADPTAMDYVQGMMIGAELELCRALGRQSYCREARSVGAASLRAFPTPLHWSPTADGLYLRFLLALYRTDGRRLWYETAYRNAVSAAGDARAGNGLYLRAWDGSAIPGGRLRTHAGTVALFAWLAATPPRSSSR
jgi:hypothetical protein